MTCNMVQDAEISPASSKPFFAANTAMNSLIIAAAAIVPDTIVKRDGSAERVLQTLFT